MKTFNVYGETARIITVLVWIFLVLAPGSMTAYGQEALPEKIKDAVERSPLPGQAKAELLDAAGRALRAGIPADDVEIIISRARDRGIGAGATRDLIDTAVKAREKGLPVRPVLNRIEQGLSKGVPPDKIAAASRNLSEKLAAAQPIVGELIGRGLKSGSDKDREYAVETVARALERSIPADTIAHTGRQVKERRGSVVLFDKAVHTLTSLTENGMPVESASRLVRSAVERGFTEKDLGKMERDVVEGLEKGKRMDDVVKSSESEIRGDRKKGDGTREDRDAGRGEDRDDRSGGSRDDRDVRRDDGRNDRNGGFRDSGSDRVREPDRGGKGKDH